MTAPFRVSKHAINRYRTRVANVSPRKAMFCLLGAAIRGTPPSDLQLRHSGRLNGPRMLYYERKRLMLVIEPRDTTQPCVKTCFVVPTDAEILTAKRKRNKE